MTGGGRRGASRDAGEGASTGNTDDAVALSFVESMADANTGASNRPSRQRVSDGQATREAARAKMQNERNAKGKAAQDRYPDSSAKPTAPIDVEKHAAKPDRAARRRANDDDEAEWKPGGDDGCSDIEYTGGGGDATEDIDDDGSDIEYAGGGGGGSGGGGGGSGSARRGGGGTGGGAMRQMLMTTGSYPASSNDAAVNLRRIAFGREVEALNCKLTLHPRRCNDGGSLRLELTYHGSAIGTRINRGFSSDDVTMFKSHGAEGCEWRPFVALQVRTDGVESWPRRLSNGNRPSYNPDAPNNASGGKYIVCEFEGRTPFETYRRDIEPALLGDDMLGALHEVVEGDDALGYTASLLDGAAPLEAVPPLAPLAPRMTMRAGVSSRTCSNGGGTAAGALDDAAAAGGAASLASGAGATSASAALAHSASGASSPSAFPAEWSAFGDEGSPQDFAWERKWQLVALDPTSHEFEDVKRQFVESMQNVVVVRVERVQHRQLWRRYANKRDEIRRKCAGIGVDDHADLRLWHGTGSTDPQAILRSESGLDERLSSKGFYGKGVYLAEHARYSNGGTEVMVVL